MPSPSLFIGALFGLAAMGMFACYDILVKYSGGQLRPFQIMFRNSIFAAPLVITVMAAVFFGERVGIGRAVATILGCARVLIALPFVYVPMPITDITGRCVALALAAPFW